jgi:hypothetical protein
VKKAVAIVLGQCSQAVRDCLEAHQEWEAVKLSLDVICLLILIRTSLFNGATTRHAIHAIMDAQGAFMMLRQGKNVSSGSSIGKHNDSKRALPGLKHTIT